MSSSLLFFSFFFIDEEGRSVCLFCLLNWGKNRRVKISRGGRTRTLEAAVNLSYYYEHYKNRGKGE